MTDRPEHNERPHQSAPWSDRLGARIGFTGGQMWTVAVLAVTIVLLLSSLKGLS